ncbi:hypothetical protein DM02DRAFT_49854 [Periconia macrospinosa]|uniref:Uncharacterized protein n=1 Tax=Periconia macrospinosa TaxID=97972 RepID=A0A2V1CYM8_9PLEO|nr:hypothetical protein DM02DRAFT_49854 [Periconia macrospinosa]
MFPAAGSLTTIVDGENQSRSRRDDEPHRPQRVGQLDRPRIRRRRGACESCKVKKTKCTCVSICISSIMCWRWVHIRFEIRSWLIAARCQPYLLLKLVEMM